MIEQEPAIRRRARAHQRRFLRRIGLRASDLDAVTVELLRAYVRKVAMIEELAPGELRLRCENSSSRALRSLELRLRELGVLDVKSDPAAALSAHLAARNGGSS